VKQGEEGYDKLVLELARNFVSNTGGGRIKVKLIDERLYKECSKYVHPSSWLINSLDNRLTDEQARKKFVAFALHYAVDIMRMLLKNNPRTMELVADVEKLS
jgi:hypothetical protein